MTTSQKLEKIRITKQLKELSFFKETTKEQRETIKLFLSRGYYNFEISNTTIFCIGGKSYDRNHVSIESDGTFIVQ